MEYKRILLLANSRKHSGRCLAGREILGNNYGSNWIRPVSSSPGAEVSEDDRRYQDGTYPRVLDIIDVPIIGAKPFGCHTENWLFSSDYYWVRQGQVDWNHAKELAEEPARLWNIGDSTYNNLNDQIEKTAAAKLTTSITMISVASVEIHVLTPGAKFGNYKKRVQARFEYRGVSYWLWVTDTKIEAKYLASDATFNKLGPCLLTISLAEPYEVKGVFYHYKLVAAIIERP